MPNTTTAPTLPGAWPPARSAVSAAPAAALLAALLMAEPVDLRAQDPDGRPTGATVEEEPDRWGAEVGLALNSSGGNESLTVLTTELGLTHLDTEAYELTFGTRFRYGRSEGEEVANNLRGSLNADFRPQAGWSPFVFATAERDPFRKLDVRLSSGSGVKRTFYRNDWDEVSLSGAVLYAYEEVAVEPELGDGITRTARWSWRGRARYQIREGTRFEQLVFFQPAWDELGDYLMEVNSSARVALTRSLAILANGLYERDSTPAPDVGADDWAVSLGLSLATAW